MDVQAQSFSVLHTFSGAEGGVPRASLVLAGKTLFGTATGGGTYGNGTVFAVNTTGTGFTNLYSFTPLNPLNGKNTDGSEPFATLIMSASTLIGTTGYGGTNLGGTLFSINTNGTDFITIYNVNNGGINALYLLSSDTLYGTIGNGDNYGSVCKINMNGSGFLPIHDFSGGIGGAYPNRLNLAGNVLYGTASSLGTGTYGIVFQVNTDGTGFTTIYTFANGNDGAYPAGLIQANDTLYGVAEGAGANGSGTIFKVNTDGTGFTILHTFSEVFLDLTHNIYTNSDGASPASSFNGSYSLILSGATLYGTANGGGTNGYGTVFKVNIDGTGFTTLYNFNGTDGAGPISTPILSGNTLYGTTSGIVFHGGNNGVSANGNATLYALTLPPPPPQLTITPLFVTWPTNFTGYVLQSTTNLGSSAVWTTNLPPPVVVNGFNTITNPISGTQQFFRLSQ